MGSGDDISIQVSLYPLGEQDITEWIFRFLGIFEKHGLNYDLGGMSTVITGDTAQVFAALEEAYRVSAESGNFVVVCTMSNAVPTEKDLDELNTERH